MKRMWLLLAVIMATAGCGEFKLEDMEDQRIHPVAVMEVSGTSGTTPYTVAFDGSSSSAELGKITSYWWMFGDGAEGFGPVVAHEYTVPGTYQAMLIVTNSADLAAQATKIITVSPGGANQKPVADIVASPLSGDAPLDVSFDGTGSYDPDGSVVSYSWHFGDGGSATGSTANNTYYKAGVYTAILVVTDDSGSSGSAEVTVTVTGEANEPPTADFSADPAAGDAPLEVTFSASASSDPDGYIAQYDWDFSDGNTGSGISVTHTYAAGDWTATLTVIDNGGAADTAQADISVNALPVASIIASPLTGDWPLAVDFDGVGSTDSDGSIVDYAWDFGDGQTAGGVSTSHTYTAPGVYTAMLVVADDSGGSDSALVSIDVTGTPNQLPSAVVNASPTSGTGPLDVTFSGSGSSDPDGSITDYDWDFGDGNVDSGMNVSHIYAPGDYTATLTVTDNDGGTDTATVDIHVNERPTADISANPTTGAATLTVNFDGSGSSDGDGSISAYEWYFGDGATATGASTSHDYTAAGTYTATLVVTDNDGASGTTSVTITVTGGTPNQPPTAVIGADPTSGNALLPVSFSAVGSDDSDGTITDYAWDFGDGATGSGITTNHTYNAGNWTATLTVTDDGGLTDVAVVDISVNARPVAEIAAVPLSGTAPLAVTFDGSGSDDGDGTIVDYAWDFGDGAVASGPNPGHTYASPGTYMATLVVTDDEGATDSASVTITVNPAVNQPPVAVIGADPTSGDAPLAVDFDGLGSYDPDGSITQYDWNFGDGQTGSGVTVSHTYTAAGSYTARLTVTDDGGAQDSATVAITALGAGPTAVIQADVYSGLAVLTVNFSGTASTPGGSPIASFNWDFGDGGTSTSATPSHNFSAGVYWVTLTVTDGVGMSDQAQTVIAVASWDEEIVRLTNIERWTADGGANLPPLKKESHIDDAALRHSLDMANNNHFSHTGTDGSSVGDRMTDAGYVWYTCGENIAAGYTSPAAVMAGWMDSPGHHANIMHTAFREIGHSYVYLGSSSYRHWWTQDFGARWNIYPVVINREEIATNSSTVNLYIYGSGWATQMMVSNSATFAGASWESYASDKTWALEAGLGIKTVYVKVRNGATERTYSDSIVVVEQ